MLKSILAGVFIGFGNIGFLCLDNKILSAFMFSIGLLVITTENLFLFTGKIGYCRSLSDFGKTLLIYIGNCIGTYLVFMYAKEIYSVDTIKEITIKYLDGSYITLFIQAMITGMLMYVAVDSGNVITIIMCVMAFILLGGKHSIAISFWVKFWEEPILSLIYLVGNAVGGQLISRTGKMNSVNIIDRVDE